MVIPPRKNLTPNTHLVRFSRPTQRPTCVHIIFFFLWKWGRGLSIFLSSFLSPLQMALGFLALHGTSCSISQASSCYWMFRLPPPSTTDWAKSVCSSPFTSAGKVCLGGSPGRGTAGQSTQVSSGRVSQTCHLIDSHVSALCHRGATLSICIIWY